MEESFGQLEESLECPVCSKILRDLLIPSHVDHIICQDCRRRVTVCPTCRGRRLHSNTSSLAARQVTFVNHKCKYSFYGCDVKMKLVKIVVHERTCPIEEV